MGANYSPAFFDPKQGGKSEVQSFEAQAQQQAAAVDATDAARSLAAEHGIDLSTVTGTGANDRITVDDVKALVEPDEPAAEEPEPTD